MNDRTPLAFDVEDSVAILTLNRPEEGNSLNPALMDALESAWSRVENDPDIRVAILTGAGERHFCTGASVGMLKFGTGPLQNKRHADVNRFTSRMCHVSKPVICAVNGLVNAGGLHFVGDSDIVIASATAQFMDSHVSVGLVSGLESMSIARRAGMGAALLMGLSGKTFRMDAERAFQLGMVDLLEDDPESTMKRARELAATLSRNSPQAMALTKRAIWASTELHEPMGSEMAWELIKSQWVHPDFQEGPRAFFEKRDPRWNPDPSARVTDEDD